jgi:Rap1a immunity proteins
VCLGNVQAVGYLGEALPAPYKICVPRGVTPEQSVRVVIQYLTARPDRLHEPFIALAVEALAQTWPCR